MVPSTVYKTLLEKQTAAYSHKKNEKTNAFHNMSVGKASLLIDLVCESDVLALRRLRQELLTWISTGSIGIRPSLPDTFPTQFLILRAGPIVTGTDDSVPVVSSVIPFDISDSIIATSHRKYAHREYSLMISLRSMDAFMDVCKRLKLKKSESYVDNWFGSSSTKVYECVNIQLSIAYLSDIATSFNSGYNGVPLVSMSAAKPAPSADEHRSKWIECELALIQASITSPALSTGSSACLYLQRHMLYQKVSPATVAWTGNQDELRQDTPMGGIQSVLNLPMAVGALIKCAAFDYIQDWFNSKVNGYSVPPDEDPPPPEDYMARLHWLLALCMVTQERLANNRESDPEFSKWGGIERDIGTPINRLSVFDPIKNSDGIFLCPTYMPSHLIRLCEWLEANLPLLSDKHGVLKLHFLHIDSEGEFFQLHTDTGGSVIIYTGMDQSVERSLLDSIREKYCTDVSGEFRSLEELTKHLLKQWTLSRLDVVLAGDRAACPIASQSIKTMNNKTLQWMDTDMTGWFCYVGGTPNHDFFLTRSIDKEIEADVVKSAPLGFKSVVDCGVGYSAASATDKGFCVCKKLLPSEWLRTCPFAHPQMWHSYPQSGAVLSKSLVANKLDWTILYYAIADLIKAKVLTYWQPSVTIEVVSPVLNPYLV